MTKLIESPGWATDTDFPAGGDDWSGQPNKVEPSSGEKGTGFIPSSLVPAEEMNWLLNNHGLVMELLADAAFGKDFALADDFAGDVIDFSKWHQEAGPNPIAPVIGDDHGAGACGAAQFDASTTVGTRLATTNKIPLTDAYFSARIRAPSRDVNSGGIGVGWGEYNASALGFFTNGAGNWQTASGFNTGVAPGSAYQLLEMLNVASGPTVYYWIDGVLVKSETGQAILTTRDVGIEHTPVGSGATRSVFLDALKIYAAR